MRFVLLIAVAMSCSALLPATTLVAVWTPRELLLGADSSVMKELAGRSGFGSACKIGHESSSFFALSGLVDDRATGLHVDAMAHAAVAESGSLEDRLGRFLELVREPLARSVQLVKQDSPAQYEYLQEGHPVLQAIFASVEQGPPSLAIAGFALDPDGALAPFAKVIAQGDDGRGPRIVYAGAQTRIREYLHEHRDWSSRAQPDLVRNLIQLEIANSGGEVGGPVDIVKLTPGAAEWVQQKSQCVAQ